MSVCENEEAKKLKLGALCLPCWKMFFSVRVSALNEFQQWFNDWESPSRVAPCGMLASMKIYRLAVHVGVWLSNKVRACITSPERCERKKKAQQQLISVRRNLPLLPGFSNPVFDEIMHWVSLLGIKFSHLYTRSAFSWLNLLYSLYFFAWPLSLILLPFF